MQLYKTFNSYATMFRYILLSDTFLERRNLHREIVLFKQKLTWKS